MSSGDGNGHGYRIIRLFQIETVRYPRFTRASIRKNRRGYTASIGNPRYHQKTQVGWSWDIHLGQSPTETGAYKHLKSMVGTVIDLTDELLLIRERNGVGNGRTILNGKMA